MRPLPCFSVFSTSQEIMLAQAAQFQSCSWSCLVPQNSQSWMFIWSLQQRVKTQSKPEGWLGAKQNGNKAEQSFITLSCWILTQMVAFLPDTLWLALITTLYVLIDCEITNIFTLHILVWWAQDTAFDLCLAMASFHSETNKCSEKMSQLMSAGLVCSKFLQNKLKFYFYMEKPL